MPAIRSARQSGSGSTGPRGAPVRPVRGSIVVEGVIGSVTVRSAGAGPALVAQVAAPGAPVDLVWLGRDAIGGIVPGRRIRAEGRAARRGDSSVIYNPRYLLNGHSDE